MGKIRSSNKTYDEHKTQSLSTRSETKLCDMDFNARRSDLAARNCSPSNGAGMRNERIRLRKASHIENSGSDKHKKKKERRLRKKHKLALPHHARNGKSSWDSDCSFKSKRMHLKVKKKSRRCEESKEKELEEIVLPEETIAKFSLILDEINRKISASSWKV